jgi:iron(III) transport system substrate-binding protein
MMKYSVKSFLAVSFLGLSFSIAAPVFAQSKPATNVAEVASLQGANRLQTLIDGAKKEGELNIYVVHTAMPGMAAAFTKKYGIKVNLWRASSENVLQRIVTEARGGRNELDIVQNNAPEMEALHREKLLQPVNSPYLADIFPRAIPAHKDWVGYSIEMYVQAYNTNKIKKEDLPKTYQDLLDPKWKGKLGIEQGDEAWFNAVLQELGPEKGTKLFKDIIAANDISVRKGHTLLGQMVASGEVPLALTLYSYNPDQMKDKGAPVERFNISQPIAQFQTLGMLKKSPHPYAAVLFYDFMLTDAQQTLFDEHDIATSKKFDTAQKNATMKFIDPSASLDQGEKWHQAYEDIFVKRNK